MKDMRGRAFAEGLARLNERKTRQMNAGPSMKPRKAQVKDKGFGGRMLGFRRSFGNKSGPRRARTVDPRIKSPLLYRLSYRPQF